MHLPASFAFLALRMWWPLVALAAVLGVGVAVVTAQGAPYRATAYLRVDTSANPVQSVQIVSTALELVDSDPVYVRMVGDSREALAELRSRSSAGILNAGEVLTIAVVAPSATQAEQDTERFAGAAVAYFQERAQDQFETITQLGQDALAQGVLPDFGAEEFRRQRIGVDVADAQAAAFRSGSLVSRIGGVQAPVELGIPNKLAIPIGGAGGALVGFVGTLLLGVRRRRVKSLSDLAAIMPNVRAYDPQRQTDGLVRVAARAAGLDRPLLAILAIPGSEGQLAHVTGELREQLEFEALRWIDTDADDLGTLSTTFAAPAAPSARHPSSVNRGLPATYARKRAIEASAADLVLVTGVAAGSTVNQVAARADMAIVVATLGRTRLGELASACGELADLSPVVVLARGTDAVEPIGASRRGAVAVTHRDTEPDRPTAEATPGGGAGGPGSAPGPIAEDPPTNGHRILQPVGATRRPSPRPRSNDAGAAAAAGGPPAEARTPQPTAE